MLPELDGRAVIRAVRRDEEAAATPILVLSARGSTIDRIAGLEDGADDYLPKPFSPAELVLRVKSILRRTTRAPTGADATDAAARRLRIRHGDLVLDPARHEVTRDGEPVPLTHVEFRLLQTLLEADGRVLTRDQLLDAVYGHDAGRGPRPHRSTSTSGRLRDKLGDDPDAPALRRHRPRRRLSGGPGVTASRPDPSIAPRHRRRGSPSRRSPSAAVGLVDPGPRRRGRRRPRSSRT